MKKGIFVLTVVTALFAVYSCKKDTSNDLKNWMCTCSDGSTVMINNQTQSQATTTCNTVGAVSNTSCHL